MFDNTNTSNDNPCDNVHNYDIAKYFNDFNVSSAIVSNYFDNSGDNNNNGKGDDDC